MKTKQSLFFLLIALFALLLQSCTAMNYTLNNPPPSGCLQVQNNIRIGDMRDGTVRNTIMTLRGEGATLPWQVITGGIGWVPFDVGFDNGRGYRVEGVAIACFYDPLIGVNEYGYLGSSTYYMSRSQRAGGYGNMNGFVRADSIDTPAQVHPYNVIYGGP